MQVSTVQAANMSRVYIGRIPRQCTKDELCNLFSSFGRIHNSYLHKTDSPHLEFTFGFVSYTSGMAACNAIEAMNGFVFLGVPLLVEMARDDISNSHLRTLALDTRSERSVRRSEDEAHLRTLKNVHAEVQQQGPKTKYGRVPALSDVLDRVNSVSHTLSPVYKCEFTGLELDLDQMEQLHKQSLANGENLEDGDSDGESLINPDPVNQNPEPNHRIPGVVNGHNDTLSASNNSISFNDSSRMNGTTEDDFEDDFEDVIVGVNGELLEDSHSSNEMSELSDNASGPQSERPTNIDSFIRSLGRGRGVGKPL